MALSGTGMQSRREMEQYFGPAGELSRLLPGYEHRREQEVMAHGVMRTLARGDVGFFEAGTGTGKSLAYLIPASLHALREEKPVVVSTYTISLQEQLIHKDIPLVQRIFPELRAVLVKGWRNYVCYQRLQSALQAPGDLLDPGHDQELAKVARWAQVTEDGTLSDLPFQPDPELWDEVCAESDSCLRSQCPHFDRCPLMRDRAEMSKAHLLVVNHHLLFSDVAVRRELGWEADAAVLPGYDSVIVDEAHHLEDVATDHLGAVLSSRGVTQLFGRIYRRQGPRGRGVVAALRRILAERGDVEQLTRLETEVAPAVARAEGAMEQLFSVVRRWRGERIGPGEALAWEAEFGLPAREAAAEARAVGSMLRRLREAIGGDGDDAFSATPNDSFVLTTAAQLDAVCRRLSALEASLAHFSNLDTDQEVYWLEREGRIGEHVRLRSAPVDVGPQVREWVAAQCQSLVLVSATLTVHGSFRYFRDRLGLGGGGLVAGRMEVKESAIASPFDYERQAMLALVRDLPEPTHPDYAERLPQAVHAFVSASRGRALVLFTSFALMERAKAALAKPLAREGKELLVQGEAPRSRLLDAFRRGEAAVLLGTDSFWEGVDVPGEALSLVVLTRLPFDVPTEPVAAARTERLQQMGRSPFAEYTLPRAVLKLKQGFGRLIRTRSDRGAVVICDRRVLEKSYGRVFLESLPPCRRISGDAADVAEHIRRFLA